MKKITIGDTTIEFAPQVSAGFTYLDIRQDGDYVSLNLTQAQMLQLAHLFIKHARKLCD